MNKAELIVSIQEHLGEDTSKAAAERALEAVLESIKTGIKEDGSVSIIGFGSFDVTDRAARQGINPKTKEPIQIAASKAVKFKAGAGLKNLVK
jgi:nucleoid DNA-binding protein